MNRQRVKISPTRQGYLFILILTALLIGSANYNNNLGFLLTFLLASMLVVSIFHTCSNLHGLHLTSVSVKPVFAKETAVFELRIRTETLPRNALEFSFASGNIVRQDFSTEAEQRIDVRMDPGTRGIFNPGPLIVSTRYPFGLIRGQFKLHLALECFVYPEPLHSSYKRVNDYYRSDDSDRLHKNEVDDFKGFKAYQPGDSLKHIAWKAFARGQGLLVKEFAGQTASAVVIDWYAIPEVDIEQKLSLLCDMLLIADKLKLNYGLKIPGIDIAPDRSEQHKHACLRALALFGSPQDSQ